MRAFEALEKSNNNNIGVESGGTGVRRPHNTVPAICAEELRLGGFSDVVTAACWCYDQNNQAQCRSPKRASCFSTSISVSGLPASITRQRLHESELLRLENLYQILCHHEVLTSFWLA